MALEQPSMGGYCQLCGYVAAEEEMRVCPVCGRIYCPDCAHENGITCRECG